MKKKEEKLQNLKEILATQLPSQFSQKIKDYQIIKQAWRDVVGPIIQKNTNFLFIKNNKAVVETKDSIWMNEISLKKTQIIQQMNQTLNGSIIEDIILKLAKTEKPF